MESSSMPSAGRHVTHRWIVVVPLVVAVVALTLREGMARPAADLTAPERTSIATDEGGDAVLAGDAVDLRAGGVLVHARGRATVSAGEWTVAVWDGDAYVALQNGQPTVAAFDVPVLVRGPGGTVVVTALRQWAAPRTATPDAATDPVGWMDAAATKPLPSAFVERQRARIDAWTDDGVAPVDGNDAASFLASADDADLAAYALRAAPTRMLAAALRVRSDLRLHALLQPGVRDASWAYLPDDAAIDAETWIALLALPTLASGDDGDASQLTVRRWGETLARALDAASDPDVVRSAVLPILERDVQSLANAGYPVRALRFADAIRGAVGTDAVLDERAASALLRLTSLTPETLRASVLADVPAPHALPSVPTADASETVEADPVLEATARSILEGRGGMFTRDSIVRTVAPGTVDVTDVVFGFPTGDRALRFRFLPADDAVRAIVDGAVQPYAVPYATYMDWEAAR